MTHDESIEKLSNLEGHVYFSKKQKAVLQQIAKDDYDSYYLTKALINGKVVEYTEIIPDGTREYSYYDDAVYLGFGKPIMFELIKEVKDSVINRFVNAKTEEEREIGLAELTILNEYKTGKREYIPQWPDIIGD